MHFIYQVVLNKRNTWGLFAFPRGIIRMPLRIKKATILSEQSGAHRYSTLGEILSPLTILVHLQFQHFEWLLPFKSAKTTNKYAVELKVFKKKSQNSFILHINKVL